MMLSWTLVPSASAAFAFQMPQSERQIGMPGERDELDHGGGDENRAETGRAAAQEQERAEVRREREREQDEEHRAEVAASRATRVRRDERRTLCPGDGDAAGDEERYRGRRDRRGSGH